MTSKEDIIQRIVEEKGIKALPNLIDLLNDEDPETRELARDVIGVMGKGANTYLLEDFKKHFNRNKKDDMVMLYLADVLAENDCKEIVPYLERMIENYSDERAFPIIIEHLWKLTKEDKYLKILETFLEDNDGMEEIAIMAITHNPTKKVIDILINKYRSSNKNSLRALILDAILKVLLADLELVPYLQEKDKEIAEKLHWHLENNK